MTEPNRWPRVLFGRFLIALVAALAITITGVVSINTMIDNKISAIKRVHLNVAPDTDPGDPANFLLIGSDSRDFVHDAAAAGAFGDPSVESGQHSDTLMVVHVDPRKQTGFLVSFPRDLIVDIPGMGRQRINAAYNAGAQKVIDTLKADFDIDIQHYLEVGFDSFRGIVDALDGVSIYFPAPARDDHSTFDLEPANFKPGCYSLSGDDALLYVRSRYYEQLINGEWVQDALSDIPRIQRQQDFMRRVATEAIKKSIDDPLAANDIVDTAFSKLTADQSLSRNDINKLINAFRNVDPNDQNSIRMVTLPWLPNPDDPNTLVEKEPDADFVLGALRGGLATNTPPSGPPPASIRTRVFNGSGMTGAAATTSTALQHQGFATAGIGDNPGGVVAKTEIRYRKGDEDKAAVVQRYAGGIGKLVVDPSIVEADVVLVLGKDFAGITAPAGIGESPATTTAGSTKSSGGSSTTSSTAPDTAQASDPATENSSQC